MANILVSPIESLVFLIPRFLIVRIRRKFVDLDEDPDTVMEAYFDVLVADAVGPHVGAVTLFRVCFA